MNAGERLTRARERRAGLRAAMADVESKVAAPAPGREAAWRDELAGALDRVVAALDLHIQATEAPDGLLAEIVERAPRLSRSVERTRADHVALRDDVTGARAANASGADVAAVRDLVVELLAHLVRHRQLGADLVYEAYVVDIEAAD